METELKTKLTELGLTEDQIAKLEAEGAKTSEDIALLSGDDIKMITDCGLVVARRVVQAFAPVPPTIAAPAGSTSGGDEIPEGSNPNPTQINMAASQLGMDPSMLTMMLLGGVGAGAGLDMDLSTVIPIPAVVGGYNPKLRNIPLLIMGQIERRLGTPIVVINDDGSVNPELTVKYVMALEEGFEAAEDNVYYDDEGKPFEVIRVGVDAQGIYDADPVMPTKALQKNGMGVGRINWHNVPLEVRQVTFYAATLTGELNPNDDVVLGRLRDKISPTTKRLDLRGDFPKAMTAYNEGLRTGSLPTLRVQLNRVPRRQQVFPSRRTSSGPRDLSDRQPARVRGDTE